MKSRECITVTTCVYTIILLFYATFSLLGNQSVFKNGDITVFTFSLDADLGKRGTNDKDYRRQKVKY